MRNYVKIELVTQNRTGITQEVLASLASHSLDIAAVEVETHHIYIDLPELTEQNYASISSTLFKIDDIEKIRRIDLLPLERRHLHLDALLSTFPDPVFAIDASGAILTANSAATAPLGLAETDLVGTSIDDTLISEDGVLMANHECDKHPVEITLADQPYLLEVIPICSLATTSRNMNDQPRQITVGNMLVLQAPPRLGGHISKVQMRGVNGFDAIAGDSSALQQIKQRALRFSSIDAPLLIQGETGTGKELFARAVHQTGPWRSAAFLALNCATLPENLVESELFGYASGAFSGASRAGKPGLFELADQGTIFLDEIGEMSLYVQAKLLRVIQDGTFRRVGGKTERRVKVRIICATHRDLEQLSQEGLFREDLMYRLNILNLLLPPLRDRKEDIELLSKLFLRRAATQIGCEPPGLTDIGLAILESLPWPGNVRQLENILFRTVAINLDQPIGEDELKGAGVDISRDQIEGEPESLKSAHAAFEKNLLEKLYQQYPSTRKLAARLSVSHTTIADKLRRYGIK